MSFVPALVAAAAVALRIHQPQAACEPLPMAVPLFGCERGTASASVKPIDGATYAWSAEGAAITGGQGTPRIAVALSDSAAARLTVVVAMPGCSRTASGIIAVRKPLSVVELKAPAAVDAGRSVTIEWTYAAGSEPVSQLLQGSAFPAPVALAREQRSYTFTPRVAGTNTIELIASHAASIPTAPKSGGGRRRAAGATLVEASPCAEVRASKQFVVRCDAVAPHIEAPQDVESGTTFTARVPLGTGETAKWSVENGTFVSGDEGESVEVLVHDLVTQVVVSVLVSRDEHCSVLASAGIPVRPRAACTTSPPTAAVALLSRTCQTATVQATFTGTPPFRGYWLDGRPFETLQPSITRDFETAGTYTITGFRDAVCEGTVSSTAELKSFYPEAVIVSEQDSCEGTRVRATFTGTPPFRGRWVPGEWFDTNETTLTMEMPPGWTWAQIQHLTDANCPSGGEGASSNQLTFRLRPTAFIDVDKVVCVAETPGFLTVNFSDDKPPYTVEWSDGVVSTSSSPHRFVSREVTTTEWNDTLEIVRATDGECQVVVDEPVVNVSFRPKPRIDTTTNSDIVVCSGEVGKIVMQPITMHPDTILTWSAVNAEILSGQGTREITFRATQPGWSATVGVEATFPDGGCPQGWREDVGVYVATPGVVSDFTVTPATIPAGGTATISFRRTGNVEHYSISALEGGRTSDIAVNEWSCNSEICSIPYRDTHGAGSVTLQLFYGGPCNPGNTPPATASFTITP